MSKNIIISDPGNLERIKEKISKEGAKNLHVLADFDRTLTKAFVDGEMIPSMVAILGDGSYLTKDYAKQSKELFDKYHPIEIDHTIPKDEKKKMMREWWEKHFKLIIKSGLNKKDLHRIIRSDKVRLREGVLEFIDLLHKQDIPLIIMSSNGLGGEAISLFLEKEGRLYHDVHIIANSYEWNEDGYVIGVKKPIIHVMNKDETIIKDHPVFEVIKNKKNVLLLGDHVGDVGMVEGFDYENLIKVGFLNENVDESLEEYKRNFDIIITNDSSMDYVNMLLNDVLNKP